MHLHFLGSYNKILIISHAQIIICATRLLSTTQLARVDFYPKSERPTL